MATFIDHQKAFISLFNQTARYHKRHKVFEDFVSCSVIALENRLQFSEAREQKYLRIVSGYEKQDVINMAHLLAHVIEGLEQGFCDFLGSVFMQLELGDKYRGQFFTPWSVASMMAQMQLGNVKALFENKPFITLSEPACGAGSMILAMADTLNRSGYPAYRRMWVSATDIDPLAAGGFAPIFPDTCYHLTHYKPAAVDIPVASDNPVHYADAIRYNARTPLQGSLLPLTRLVWA